MKTILYDIELTLKSSIKTIDGIAEKTSVSLSKLNIINVNDLIHYYPLRYIDFSKVKNIGEINDGDRCVVVGDIYELNVSKTKFGEKVSFCIIDGTGAIVIDVFSNSWVKHKFSPGHRVVASGYARYFSGMLHMTNPIFSDAKNICATGIIPVYRSNSDCSQATIRSSIARTLKKLKVQFDQITLDDAYISYGDALSAIHCQTSDVDLKSARKAIKKREIMLAQYSLAQRGSDLISEIINTDSEDDLGANTSLTHVFQRDEFDNFVKDVNSLLTSDTTIFVICPLANVKSKERDAMCKSFDFDAFVPEVKRYSNIAIEDDKDCKNVDFGIVDIKKAHYCKIFELGEESVKVVANITARDNLNKNDVVIVEDADRFSILQLNKIRKRAGCDCFFLVNSKWDKNIDRIKLLMNTNDEREIVFGELRLRRDGDIFGNKFTEAKLLKLVNITRDLKLIEKCKQEVEDKFEDVNYKAHMDDLLELELC